MLFKKITLFLSVLLLSAFVVAPVSAAYPISSNEATDKIAETVFEVFDFKKEDTDVYVIGSSVSANNINDAFSQVANTKIYIESTATTEQLKLSLTSNTTNHDMVIIADAPVEVLLEPTNTSTYGLILSNAYKFAVQNVNFTYAGTTKYAIKAHTSVAVVFDKVSITAPKVGLDINLTLDANFRGLTVNTTSEAYSLYSVQIAGSSSVNFEDLTVNSSNKSVNGGGIFMQKGNDEPKINTNINFYGDLAITTQGKGHFINIDALTEQNGITVPPNWANATTSFTTLARLFPDDKVDAQIEKGLAIYDFENNKLLFTPEKVSEITINNALKLETAFDITFINATQQGKSTVLVTADPTEVTPGSEVTLTLEGAYVDKEGWIVRCGTVDLEIVSSNLLEGEVIRTIVVKIPADAVAGDCELTALILGKPATNNTEYVLADGADTVTVIPEPVVGIPVTIYINEPSNIAALVKKAFPDFTDIQLKVEYWNVDDWNNILETIKRTALGKFPLVSEDGLYTFDINVIARPLTPSPTTSTGGGSGSNPGSGKGVGGSLSDINTSNNNNTNTTPNVTVTNPPTTNETNIDPIETPLGPVTTNKGFIDVDKSHWAYDAIMQLDDKGIVTGFGDNSFKPSDSLTRAQFSVMIFKSLQFARGDSSKKFSDVNSPDWFVESVDILSSIEIINGFEDGTFKPSLNISREQMAVIIYKALLSKNITLEKTHDDLPKDYNDVSDYAKEAVKILYQSGLITGVGQGNYAPKDNATRAQAAVIVNNLIKLAAK